MKNKFKPKYPRRLNEAIAMLQKMHDEDKTDIDYMKGFRQALRIGINMIEAVKRNNRLPLYFIIITPFAVLGIADIILWIIER